MGTAFHHECRDTAFEAAGQWRIVSKISEVVVVFAQVSEIDKLDVLRWTVADGIVCWLIHDNCEVDPLYFPMLGSIIEVGD